MTSPAPCTCELKEIGGAAPDLGLARVCVTDATWGAANPGPYDALPEADCAAGETVDLGRDASALSWLGDITALVAAAEGDDALPGRATGRQAAG